MSSKTGNKEKNRRNTPSDRRRLPTPICSRYTFIGKRRRNQRLADPKSNYYVDLYSAWSLAILLLIVILSLLDAFFTFYHISLGGKELNPIMDVLLDYGAHAFFPFKFLLTGIGIFILCIHKNFSLVRVMTSFILVVYILLTFYHVSLLYAY
jgi:hypothetical protein